MGEILIALSVGALFGGACGFYIGYAWSESRIADKVTRFAGDVYSEIVELKSDIKREIREFKDDIEK